MRVSPGGSNVSAQARSGFSALHFAPSTRPIAAHDTAKADSEHLRHPQLSKMSVTCAPEIFAPCGNLPEKILYPRREADHRRAHQRGEIPVPFAKFATLVEHRSRRMVFGMALLP